MAEMTTRERMRRMYEHREADRVPITDLPWAATIERWQKEGLPEDVSFVDYFGLDKIIGIWADNSPQYPQQVLEQTEEYQIVTTRWGATQRRWKHTGGVPENLSFTITSPETWKEAKARMQPTRDRVDWERLRQNWARWREEGAWIEAYLWFGFDVVHAHAVGTERVLIAMMEQPEWVADMINHWLDVELALFEQVWEAGYHFDGVYWWDDMGYKGHQFFSLRTYRELVKPAHRRAAEWAHAKGLKVNMHSCGYVEPFIPDLIEIGIDMLNPLEVKAGMDPVKLKGLYGDRLAFQGGLNAVLYGEPEQLWAEMRRVIPIMKRKGGYIISSDHSVPQSVSLEQFRQFVELGKELGRYD